MGDNQNQLPNPTSKTLSHIPKKYVTKIEQIFENGAANFRKIKKEGGTDEIVTFIITETIRFISVNFPSTPNISLVASEFATDLIDEKDDWKADDVIMFFKFVRTQGSEEIKVFGNIITPIKLFELVRFYEQEKSDKRASHFFKRKEVGYIPEKSDNPQIAEYVNKIQENIEKAKALKPHEQTGVIQNAFDPIRNLKHFEQFKQLITDSTPEEKEKWRKSIVVFESIDEIEMQRKTELLKLLQ